MQKLRIGLVVNEPSTGMKIKVLFSSKSHDDCHEFMNKAPLPKAFGIFHDGLFWVLQYI